MTGPAPTAPSRRRELILLLVVAAIIRLLAFVELNSGPCHRMHLWNQTDMWFFDYQGSALAAGDWGLKKAYMHPHFDWMRTLADKYLERHPELKEESRQRGIDPRRQVWNLWLGEREFYQEPLYPCLVGVTYAVCGHRPEAVLFWQLVLGVVSVGLLWDLCSRLFGPTAGTLSGWLMALCGPLIFYENLLLRESSIVFMSVLLLWVWTRRPKISEPVEKKNLVMWAVSFGLTCGAAWMLKTTFVPLMAILWCAWIVQVYHERKTPDLLGHQARAMLCASLALSAVVAPFVVRNVSVGVAPLHFTSVGALNAVSALSAQSPLSGMDFNNDPLGIQIMDETKGRFGPALIRSLQTHPDVGSVLAQVGRKFQIAVNTREIPDNATIEYFRLFSKILAWLPVTLLMLVPFGFLGTVSSVWRYFKPSNAAAFEILQPIWPIGLMAAISFLPLLVFNPIGRYRVGFIALLIPFAALGLIQLHSWIKNREWYAGAAVLALGGCAWFVSKPIPFPPIRAVDYEMGWKLYYKDLLTELAQAKDAAGMDRAAAEIFSGMPGWVGERVRQGTRFSANESGIAYFFWGMRKVMTGHQSSLTSMKETGPEWLEAVPGLLAKKEASSAEEMLGKVALSRPAPEGPMQAIYHFERSLGLDSQRHSAAWNRALALLKLGKYEYENGSKERAEALRQVAIPELRRLATLNPETPETPEARLKLADVENSNFWLLP